MGMWRTKPASRCMVGILRPPGLPTSMFLSRSFHPHMRWYSKVLLEKSEVGKLPPFKQAPETVEDQTVYYASGLSWNHFLTTEQQPQVSYNIYRLISVIP